VSSNQDLLPHTQSPCPVTQSAGLPLDRDKRSLHSAVDLRQPKSQISSGASSGARC